MMSRYLGSLFDSLSRGTSIYLSVMKCGHLSCEVCVLVEELDEVSTVIGVRSIGNKAAPLSHAPQGPPPHFEFAEVGLGSRARDRH